MFIVKVQASLATSHKKRQVLVYDKVYARDPKRGFFRQQAITKAISDLLNGRPKAYFEADIKGGQLVLVKEAPCQEW